MLRPYLKIWEWEWIFGRAVRVISSPGVRSPWVAGSMLHSRRSIKSKYSMNQGVAKIKEITVYGAQVIGWSTGIASTAYGQ